MNKSGIEWTEYTWNPIVGCTKCSPGCDNCYAERMACRLNQIFAANDDVDNWSAYSSVLKFDYSEDEAGKPIGWNNDVCLMHSRLNKPLRWKKPRRIFVCSMSDLFHESVPEEFIDKVFQTTLQCHQHTFQILTKRIKRAAKYQPCKLGWPKHIHLGVSVSTQAEADEKIPILLKIPAAVRFVSIEPMLEEIDLTGFKPWYGTFADNQKDGGIRWIIVGCESGPKRRPCKKEWIGSIVARCRAAEVPVFVKQVSVDGKIYKMPPQYPQEWPQC